MSGHARPQRQAFRQVVIEPRNKMANIPAILIKLVIISIMPLIDGWLKPKTIIRYKK